MTTPVPTLRTWTDTSGDRLEGVKFGLDIDGEVTYRVRYEGGEWIDGEYTERVISESGWNKEDTK